MIPAESIDDPLIGHVVAGRYTVLEHIGDGGVGIVYKARQEPIGRLVALKMLLSDATNDRNVERFLREARIISSLRHPNTVTLIDFGQAADGRLFIAMELLTGGELRDLMKGGRVALVPALRVARQIASSLAEAHAADIWHRDLKPENVLFDEVEGEALVVRVVDFGMAKLHEPDNDIMLTAPGTRMGTPEYMSPQQAFFKTLYHRTELYSGWTGGEDARSAFIGKAVMLNQRQVLDHLREAGPGMLRSLVNAESRGQRPLPRGTEASGLKPLPQGETVRVFVSDVIVDADGLADLGPVLASEIQVALQAGGRFQPLTLENLEAQLRKEKKKALLSCADDGCVQRIIENFGIPDTIFGRVKALGAERLHITLTWTRAGDVLHALTALSDRDPGALLEATRDLATRLAAAVAPMDGES